MPSAILDIRGLSKSFTPERAPTIHVLDRVSFSVEANEFVCFVGPSGCGKTTILKIIAGLETADEGSVLFHGSLHTSPDRRIGMVFQEYSLLPWRTVASNVTLGLEFRRAPAEQRRHTALRYLDLVGLSSFSSAYPHELSGGMQQRVAIARALANDPEVLLMDEPFGALDAHTRILMQRELLRIWEQDRKTVLFVTHSVDEAIYLADRIYVLSLHPARIKASVEVPLDRPRDRGNPVYGRLAADLLRLLEDNTSL